jgi:Uma2 family endonuclease
MPITQLSQLDLNGSYTYADYLTWKFQEYVELIKGHIYKMAAPSRYHQRISIKITGKLFNFFEGHPCHLYAAPFDVRLSVKGTNNKAITTVVQPDICVICDLTKLDKRGCIGAPDLVIEILSPGNTHKEMHQKYQVYEESGVLEYWLIHPEDKNIIKYVRNEAGIFIGFRPITEDEIFYSTIFPELSLSLQDVFQY